MKLHVCVGSTEDARYIKKSAKSVKETSWIVPKAAQPYDRVLIYHGKGIISLADIKSHPRPSQDWGDGWYEADLGRIELIEPVVSLQELQKEIPKWKWTTYPRGYTTPGPEIERKLLDYVSTRQPKA